MLGKQKCRILKEIRQRIADENDIPYVTRECSFQGECRGTCPRCESELRYLERQLALRASLKKGVTVAALCAGMAGLSFAASGCSSSRAAEPVFGQNDLSGAAPPEEIELSGEVDSSYYEYSGQEAASDSALQAASSESALPWKNSPGITMILCTEILQRMIPRRTVPLSHRTALLTQDITCRNIP